MILIHHCLSVHLHMSRVTPMVQDLCILCQDWMGRLLGQVDQQASQCHILIPPVLILLVANQHASAAKMTETGSRCQERTTLLLVKLTSILLYLVQVYMIQIVDMTDFNLTVMIAQCTYHHVCCLMLCWIECYITIHCVSKKHANFCNGIAQNCKDRFWWHLAEIFKRLE